MLVDAVELDAVFFAEGDATLASEFGVGAGVGGSFGGGRVFVLLLGEFLALAFALDRETRLVSAEGF